MPFGKLVVVNAMLPSVPPQVLGPEANPVESVGLGFIVMSKLIGEPDSIPSTGVTVIEAICCELTLAAIKLWMLPEPEAPSPIAVLLFVQLNVTPSVPVKAIADIISLAQAVTSLTGST